MHKTEEWIKANLIIKYGKTYFPVHYKNMVFKECSISSALCLVTQSCLVLCDPMDCSPLGASVRGESAGKNTGVCYRVLCQTIFPIQGLNPGLLHCRWILYCVSHQGSPYQH